MAIELKEMLGEITGISIRILGVMHLEIDLNLLLHLDLLHLVLLMGLDKLGKLLTLL